MSQYEYHREVLAGEYHPKSPRWWGSRIAVPAHMLYALDCGHVAKVEGRKKRKLPKTLPCETCARPLANVRNIQDVVAIFGTADDRELMRFCSPRTPSALPTFVDRGRFSDFVLDWFDLESLTLWQQRWSEAVLRAYFHVRNPGVSRIVSAKRVGR